MTPEAVQAALEATHAWSHPFQVHITGGEPFLNFPLLRHTLKVCVDLGIPRYVETNAGWCVDEDEVRERLLILREEGLDAILISCSPFHAVTIPPHRTELAIRIAHEVFGPQRVIIFTPDWTGILRSFGSDNPIPLTHYIDLYGAEKAGQLFWQGYRLISGGRSGYALGELTVKKPATAFQHQNCLQEILFAHHSHFDLYGNYISWFCGGLSVGNWRDLPTLLTEYSAGDFPPLIERLVASGPFGLFRYAADRHGYEEAPHGYAGKCHLCVDVRRHLTRARSYSELQPAAFYDMIEA
jgi:hypothetical protein